MSTNKVHKMFTPRSINAKILVIGYAYVVMFIVLVQIALCPVANADPPDDACVSGTHMGSNSGLINADDIPCDVIINAIVDNNQASLIVDVGSWTKSNQNDDSLDIGGVIVFFPPREDIKYSDGSLLNDDSTSVMGNHKVSLYTGDNDGAIIQLNAHTSPKHGIATGSYEGQMVCIGFCQKNSVLTDPSTIIQRNDDESCPPNDSNTCTLSENSWGYKIGNFSIDNDETSANCSLPANYYVLGCEGKRPIEYGAVPKSTDTPAKIIDIPSDAAHNTETKNVYYGVVTNKNLRPGLYGVTTIYTLTMQP